MPWFQIHNMTNSKIINLVSLMTNSTVISIASRRILKEILVFCIRLRNPQILTTSKDLSPSTIIILNLKYMRIKYRHFTLLTINFVHIMIMKRYFSKIKMKSSMNCPISRLISCSFLKMRELAISLISASHNS